MAKQTVDIGSTANDGTGDSIREAFRKANDQIFAKRQALIYQLFVVPTDGDFCT